MNNRKTHAKGQAKPKQHSIKDNPKIAARDRWKTLGAEYFCAESRPVHCFDLTMRQRALIGTTWVSLNEDRAMQNMHHFMNLLHHHYYRGNFVKKNRFIGSWAVLQRPEIANIREDYGNLHYHLALAQPETDSCEMTLAHNVFRLWQKTIWGRRICFFRPYVDKGRIEYNTRLRTDYCQVDLVSSNWLKVHKAS